jgi:hypothetical protein
MSENITEEHSESRIYGDISPHDVAHSESRIYGDISPHDVAQEPHAENNKCVLFGKFIYQHLSYRYEIFIIHAKDSMRILFLSPSYSQYHIDVNYLKTDFYY